MKKTIMFPLFIGILLSCEKKVDIGEETELVGIWKLKEVLADPGDGSGTFHSVSSNKSIEFHTEGTVSSNGVICDMSIESNTSSTGTYLLADSTINSPDCADLPIKIRFKITGSSLVIIYPCFEACLAKYYKE